MKNAKSSILIAAAAAFLAATAANAEPVKIGMITTLSGGGACPLIWAMMLTPRSLHDSASAPPVGLSHAPVRYSPMPF